MLWCLVIIAIWIATTYGVSKLGSMAIEALILNADAVEITAPTTVPTTTDAKVVGEFVEEFVGESSKVEGKVESTVTIPAEPTPELPHQTIGEVDAEAEENYWIEKALLAKAHRIDNCKITYYCCERYSHICGTGDGLTAMGGRVLPGVSCAVPKEIPLGSTIMIDWGDGELEYRRADDRGGGVKSDHIDLAVPTHKGALELGVKYATVYWCEE